MKTLLVGDVCPTDFNAQLFKDKDTDALFGDTACLFKDKDFIFANLECALTEREQNIKKFGPCLKGPVETADMLKKMGVTVCGMSNNHVFDFGIGGAEDTIKALTDAGVGYTGFGSNYEESRKNYTFEKDGERICMIAVCEHEYSYALEDRMGARPYDEYHTIEDIRAAKAEHDRVIVAYHGGKEHCKYPSPRLRRLCHAMARNGADVILCQHSHCIGAYELYNDCHILYGQGNFHFIRAAKFDTWFTCFATEYDTKTHEISFIPVRSDAVTGGIQLAGGEDKQEILDAFDKRNEQMRNGEWLDGWRDFCTTNKNGYIRIVSKACLEGSTERDNALFAHYLDCEAHTDVWRELFPTYNLTNEK